MSAAERLDRPVAQFHMAPLEKSNGFEVNVIYTTGTPHGHFTVANIREAVELLQQLVWRTR